MARDYEDIHDIDSLDDGELRDLVRSHLADTGGVDADNITVRVNDGVVHLTGRIGTESELRIAERAIVDGLGVQNVENELVVDALRRSENSDHAGEAAMQDELESGMLGSPPEQQEPSAAHLSDDLDAHRYGTLDVGEAIEEGAPYTPPDSPTPEGLEGTGAGPEVFGEEH